MKILIYKSRGVLELWNEDQRVLEIPVGIGRGGPGHKMREGDLKTPEGEYAICVKNPRSQFFLSLGLNYPNPTDAERGLNLGMITQAEYQSICEAHRQGKIPPWKTALGGEIYLHGHREKSGSTRGCVCLNDLDMEKVFLQVAVGMPVKIIP